MMPTAVMNLEPFGIAAVAGDLDAARKFYTTLYPYPVTDGVFGGIKYLSIMKDGVTLVNVFEKSAQNPMKGMLPILKVGSVPESSQEVTRLGGKVLIPESICPCTDTKFALCEDSEGNQFMVKEAA